MSLLTVIPLLAGQATFYEIFNLELCEPMVETFNAAIIKKMEPKTNHSIFPRNLDIKLSE